MISMACERAARRALLALIGMASFGAGCTGTSRPAIVVSPSIGSPTVLAVSGLETRSLDTFDHLEPQRRQEVLQAWVADAPAGAPPILGQTAHLGNQLVFAPRYPFQPGVNYRARFEPSVLSLTEATIVSEFSIPAPSAERAVRVVAIYPTSDELPENLLKFYIHFSGPMSRGEAYQHIHLLDDKGQPVAGAFLELEEELWNPQMTRFTLFFDPGRMKHGLVSQMQLGPALMAGKTYTLTIDAAWHDSEGRPLVQSVTKTFRATAAERRQPDPSRWRIMPPSSKSIDPFLIDFDEPLDEALLQRVLSVHDANGRPVPGRITLSDHERRWSFTPDSTWRAGHYTLSIETILEDLAGNSIGRPFEVDPNQGATAEKPGVISIPVTIR
jgi:hypothetical protein